MDSSTSQTQTHTQRLTHCSPYLLTHSPTLTHFLTNSQSLNILTFYHSLVHSFTSFTLCLLKSCVKLAAILSSTTIALPQRGGHATRKRTTYQSRVHCCLYFILSLVSDSLSRQHFSNASSQFSAGCCRTRVTGRLPWSATVTTRPAAACIVVGSLSVMPWCLSAGLVGATCAMWPYLLQAVTSGSPQCFCC